MHQKIISKLEDLELRVSVLEDLMREVYVEVNRLKRMIYNEKRSKGW